MTREEARQELVEEGLIYIGPAAMMERWIDERHARREAEAKAEVFRRALVGIMAHTGYYNPTMPLLEGLLANIARIAGTALKEPRP